MGDAVQCKCALGYFKTEVNCFGTSDGTCAAFTCTSCNATNSATPIAYSDRSACTSCDSTLTSGAGTWPNLECTCPSGMVLLETNSTGYKLPAKICSSCPAGTAPVLSDTTIAGKAYTADQYTCQSCPDEHMSMSSAGVCTCDSDYTITGVSSIGGQSCVHSTMIAEFINVQSASSLVTYEVGMSVASITIQHYYAKAAAECKYYGGASNQRACQILGNLCVLQMYDASFGPCKDFQTIIEDRGTTYTQDVALWGVGMPWLYYDGGATSCTDNSYRTQTSLNEQQFRYMVASYTLNGTFNGFQELETLFYYCSRAAPFSGYGAGTGQPTGWQLFGATQGDTYKCDLDSLLGQEQLFYELYLFDPKDTSTASGYYPVPVRIVDLQPLGSSGAKLNPKRPSLLCDKTDHLVRRFTLFDVVSGLSSTSSSIPEVVRYASDITVEVALSGINYGIYSPVLSIEYGLSQPGSWPAADTNDDTTVSTTETAKTVKYNWQGRYTMSMKTFENTLYGFGITASVFAGLHALSRVNSWSIRHNRLSAPGSVGGGQGQITLMAEFCLMIISSWVYWFFPIHLIICWYFFAFFKLQGVPDTMLPPVDSPYSYGDPYYVFTTNLTIMWMFMTVYVLVLVYRQCNADIFFLDWEPAAPKSHGSKDSKVSVWRTIFVANEWIEMQTMRKIDIKMNLFLLGFFLLGLDQEYAATQQPQVSNLDPGPTNLVLRFANTTFWWLIFSGGQYMWKFLIYERFFAETQEQLFIDFCTIAKISILVLDEPFHGYYLHCRSPHQHADGTMAELMDMLHKEEAGLTVDRSLDGGPTDVQSFQIFMSAEWKMSFSKIYANLVRPSSMTEMLGGMGRKNRPFSGAGHGGHRGKDEPNVGGGMALLPSDRVLKAWKEMSTFLQEFVENNFGKPGLKRVIREPSQFDTYMNIPPDINIPDQPNVFFPDRQFKYTSVLFLGREVELLLFNILTYSVFDMWVENTCVAILCCYLFDYALTYIRHTYGTALVSGKTLIDDRFLM